MFFVQLGEQPERIDFEQPQEAYATHVLHSLQSGTYKAVQIDDELMPHVYRQVLYAREGDRIEPFNGANRAIGIVFAKFDSAQQMRDNMGKINDSIHILLG